MTIINMPYSDKGRDEHDRVFGKTLHVKFKRKVWIKNRARLLGLKKEETKPKTERSKV